jgi:hypothetical protein
MYSWLSSHHLQILKPLFAGVLLFMNLAVHAQEKKIIINGKVTSFEESLPIEGAGIVVKGTNNQTGTQPDGTFSISVSPSDKILVVALSGYQTQEIKLTGATDYDIILKAAGNVHFMDFRCCENNYCTGGSSIPFMAER